MKKRSLVDRRRQNDKGTTAKGKKETRARLKLFVTSLQCQAIDCADDVFKEMEEEGEEEKENLG